MDDLQKWVMGIFAAVIIGFNFWVARSISSLKAENAAQAAKMAEQYASASSIREMRREIKDDFTQLRIEFSSVANLLHELVGETRARRE